MSQSYDAILVGGGITGLGAAYRLGRAGKRVLLLEKADSLGGLAGCYVFPEFAIERYYHHEFFDDHAFFQAVDELGLREEIVEAPASTGYLVGGKVYPLDTPSDIARFRPLGLWGVFRLGLLVLRIRSIRDQTPYDTLPLRPWVEKIAGRHVYRTFFQPLLRAKFGALAEEISAAWFIARIKLRSNRGVQGETLIYMRHGFQALHDALIREVDRMVEIRTGTAADKIVLEQGRVAGVEIGGKLERAPAVLSSIAPSLTQKLLPDAPPAFLERLGRVRYQGTICMLLALKRSLTKIYWLNIGDADVPFGILLEHNNLYDNPAYGHRLVYVANYIQGPEEKMWSLSDEEIFELYLAGLGKLFGLRREEVAWWRLSRTLYSAPLYRVGFLRDKLPVKTEVPGLYTAGMFNSYPERSINDSLRLGFETAAHILGQGDGAR
jgi:protoporphyrinogen oxidase